MCNCAACLSHFLGLGPAATPVAFSSRPDKPSWTCCTMERDAFASLFSQPQPGNKKKSKKASSSPRKHVNSLLGRSNKRPRSSAASPSSSSSASLSAAAASSRTGSRFLECPLCEKSVHSSLAQSHVERCDGREDNPVQDTPVVAAPTSATALSPSVPSAPATGGPIAAAAACVSLSPQAAGGKGNARAVISPGGAECSPHAVELSASQVIEGMAVPDAGTSGAGVGRTPLVIEAGTAAAPATTAVSSTCSAAAKSPPSPTNTGSGTAASNGRRGSRSSGSNTMDTTTTARGNNAFATLMAASALANFREEMYLWAHEDGTLSWGWGTVGNPLPPPSIPPPTKDGVVESSDRGSSSGGTSAATDNRRWSCQVATKGPDGRKAGMCDLWTNLPSVKFTPSVEVAGTAGTRSAGVAVANRPAASDDNAGLKAARPRQSLCRLPVAVLKSMLQKNVRRGRAEAAVRCALELALKSWNDAIRRVLVIIVEDSLLHPAAPLLTWLMVATSKGYRPPHRLLEAFLCVVHETAACPVRDSTASSRHRHLQQHQRSAVSFDAEEFSVPHPQSLLSFRSGYAAGGGSSSAKGQTVAAGAAEREATTVAAANIRRALLMRVSYGGMAWDQALLKGACLAWGERCGHLQYCCCCGRITPCSAPAPSSPASLGASRDGGCVDALSPSKRQQRQPPEPPIFPLKTLPPSRTSAETFVDRSHRGASRGTAAHVGSAADAARSGSSQSNITAAHSTHFPPFGYAHKSVLAALRGNGWIAFLAAAHVGTGMPPVLRSELLEHVASGTTVTGDARGAAAAAAAAGAEGRDARDTTQKRPGAAGIRGGAGTAGGGGAVATTERTTDAQSRRIGPILREADAILSGVDFHCSSVLDELLRSTAIAAKIGKALLRHRSERRIGGGSSGSGGDGNDNDGDNGEAIGSPEAEIVSVRQAAKKAMWACSSGLNVRRLRIAFRPEEKGGWSQEDGDCEESGEREKGQEGVGRDVNESSSSCRCRRCCCSSSPGFLEEIPGVGTGEKDDVLSLAPGDSGSGDVCASSCDDMDARVWASMSSDVSVWARTFVRGRLARG